MIGETTARASYTANGSTTDFAFLFKVYTKHDVEVLVNGTVQQLDTDYQVRGDSGLFEALASSVLPSTGTIRFIDANGVAEAPDSGAIITILRKQAAAQGSDYVAGQSFPAASVEKDLDKLMMAIQQAREVLARALTFAKKSSLTNGVVDDPTEGYFARAKVGGGIDWAQVVSAGEVTIPVPINEGGTGSATAADARTALGVPASADVLALAGGTMTGDILFTDSTYDIGKTGATRPRDLFVARNVAVGGTLQVTGTISPSGLVDMSGAGAGQVKFPATQNASADANTLDDYEEGTWTPSVGGTATYITQTGTYTKIGRAVTIQCSLTINSIGSGNQSVISGLPFACSGRATGAVVWNGAAASYVTVVAITNDAATTLSLFGLAAAGASLSGANVLQNSTNVAFSLTYFV